LSKEKEKGKTRTKGRRKGKKREKEKGGEREFTEAGLVLGREGGRGKRDFGGIRALSGSFWFLLWWGWALGNTGFSSPKLSILEGRLFK